MAGESGKKSEAMREVAVGFFVLAIFAGLFVFTVLLNGASLFSRDGASEIDVMFDRVGGLRRHDTVLVRGMPVGEVERLELDEGGVKVRLKLTRKITIRESYEIRPESSSLLGGMQLVIIEGEGEQVADGTILTGKSPENVMDNINGAVSDIRQALNEGGILTNLESTVADISVLTHRLREGEGTLGRLFSTNDVMFVNLDAAIANLRSISDRLEKGEGSLGKLLSSDSAAYDDLAAALANLRSISDRLEKGEGTLGKLLSSDDSLYADLHDSVSNLKLITGRLEKGEGALGQLMREDGELTLEINGFLKDGRDLLDDLRETSPISTFSSIFFGAL